METENKKIEDLKNLANQQREETLKEVKEVKSFLSENQKNIDVLQDGLAKTNDNLNKLAELMIEKEKKSADVDPRNNIVNAISTEIKSALSGNNDNLMEIKKIINAEISSSVEKGASFNLSKESGNKILDTLANLELKTADKGKIDLFKDKLYTEQISKGRIPLIETKGIGTTDALRENTNADGGYYARPSTSGGIVSSIISEPTVYDLVSKISINSSDIDYIVDNAEISGNYSWEEGDAKNSEIGKTEALTIGTAEFYAKTKITRTVIEDASFDLTSYINDKIAKTFLRVKERDILTGAGNGRQPSGILNIEANTTDDYDSNGNYIPRTRALETKKVSTTLTETTLLDNLIEFSEMLDAGYNGVWCMHPSTWTAILKSKMVSNEFQFDRNLMTRDLNYTLLGKRVVLSKYMPKMFTNYDVTKPIANVKGIILGDFSGYMFVNRNTFVKWIDPYTAGDGFIKFVVRDRFGGNVIDYNSFKILQVNK